MSLKKGRPSSYRGWKINLFFAGKALAGQCHYCAWFQQGDDSVVLTLMLLLVSLVNLTSLLWAVLCNCTHPPQVSSPFKVCPTIPIQPFKVSRATVRSGGSCVKSLLSAECTTPGEASSSMKSLQFTVKRGWKRVSGGNCVAEHCRLNWEFLLWRPVVKKNNKASSYFLFTRGQARQRVGVSPGQMKLARISKKFSVHK